jgi:DNA-binding beta-propeller fold protein YncE
MIHGPWAIALIVFFMLPTVAFAGTLMNGMPASDALGQYDDNLTSPSPIFTKSAANDGPNKLGLNNPSEIALDATHHRLFIADNSNNRVLVYNLSNANALLSHIPDNVLGQANFYTKTSATTQAGMNGPEGVAYDATHNRLFVSEYNNNRVLVFDVTSITNGMNASYVLGQSVFTASGTAVTQSGLSAPVGMVYDATNDHLFVSDSGSNRILVFSGASVSNGMNANTVIGQSSFTVATAGTTRSKLSSFATMAYDAGRQRLFVADYNNKRVLVFSGAALGNGMNANYVLGQNGYTTSTGATTQTGMKNPFGIAFDSSTNHLFVHDAGSNRILVYSGSSLSNFMTANTVIGQTSFTVGTSGTTQSTLNGLGALAYDATNAQLFVADASNNRALIFNTATLGNGMSASDAIGQYDASLTNPQPVYTKGTANNGGNILGFNNPFDLALDAVHHRLFVSDFGNNRILVYNLDSSNQLPDRIPDYVLGQSNFYSNAAATSQTGLHTPIGLAYDSVNNRLLVGDYGNNRVLLFDVSTITNGMNASYVLGQANFGTATSARTSIKMFSPEGVAYDPNHDRIIVGDTNNDRVLIFTGGALSNGMPAAYVLGQADFTTKNNTASRSIYGKAVNQPLYDPVHDRLYVPTWDNRVMVYTGTTITNGMNAAYVLGQANFTSTTGTTTASGMSIPHQLACDSTCTQLFVADGANNRVLVFSDVSTITNGMAASYVIGQPTFTSIATVASQVGGMNAVYGIDYNSASKTLYVADEENNRVLLYNLSTPTFSVSPSSATLGSTLTFTLTDSSLNTDSTSRQTTTISDGQENITLTETALNSGVFTGSIPTAYGKAANDSGTFEFDPGATCSGTASFTYTNNGVTTATATLNAPSSCTPSTQTSGTTDSSSGGGGGGGGGGRSVSVSIPTTTPFSNTTTTTATLTSSTPLTGNTVIDGTIKRLNIRIDKMLAKNPNSVFAKAIQRRILELIARVRH